MILNKYAEMQQKKYDQFASRWSINDRDHVVGSFDAHNCWEDYSFIFKDFQYKDYKNGLDFGCGPGRNLVQYNPKFGNLDGVDVSQVNLDNAKKWLSHNGCPLSNLIKCNGIDLSNIEDNCYTSIISTIVLQHLCVHEIRFNYLKEFHRILKDDGILSFQMGFGRPILNSVGYYENNYDAIGTNRRCDTRVEDVKELEDDLKKVGFDNINHYIRPVGPGDGHPNWIFINARNKR